MSALREVHVNGEPCTEAWPQDRGLHYGDGLFETLIVRDGKLRFEALHRARLARGCQQLVITLDQQALWDHAAALAAKHGNAIIKLLVSRGSAVSRGYAPSGKETARWISYVYGAPQTQDIPDLVTAVTLPKRMGENPNLAGIKHCNRLEQVLARLEVQSRGAFEGLLGSSSGYLVSGTMCNVFLEQDGALLTPVLDRFGIAGVMRQVVLREAARLGLTVRLADIPYGQLASCSGAFLTNVRLGVQPVHRLDNRPLQTSIAVQQLQAQVAKLVH